MQRAMFLSVMDRLSGLHLCRNRFVSLLKWGQFYITKTRVYSLDPLRPHLYKVKLGFTGGIR